MNQNSTLRINSKIFAVLFFLIYAFNNANSQEYFGQIPGPDGDEVKVLAVNKNDILFAGMWGGGMKRSTDNGNNWTDINTGLTNKYITSIIFVEVGTTLYTFIGTHSGGIFRSENDGNEWVEVNTGLNTGYIKCLTSDTQKNLYAGTLGFGVFKSTDNGDSWKLTIDALYHHDINAIAVTKDESVVVATNGGGIYRSVNGGISWARANASTKYPVPKYVNSFYKDKETGEIIACSNGAGLYKTVNNGLSWTPIDTVGLMDYNITCVTQNADYKYVAGMRSRGVQWYDDDLHGKWFPTQLRMMGINTIVANSQNIIFAAAPGFGIYRSTDGENFATNIAFQSIFANFKVSAQTGGNLWSSYALKGIEKSTNYGKSWENKGFVGVLVKKIQATPNRVFALASNNLHQSVNGGDSWTALLPTNFGDTTVSTYLYSSSGALYYSILWVNPAMPPMPPDPGFVQRVVKIRKANSIPGSFADLGLAANNELQYIVETSNGDIYAYAEKEGVYRLPSGSSSWELKGASVFNTLDINNFQSKGNTLFASATNGLWISTDNGNNWTQHKLNIRSVPGDGPITPNVGSVAARSTSEFVAIGRTGYGTHRTTDGGTTWEFYNYGHTAGIGRDGEASSDGDLLLAANSLYLQPNPANMPIPPLVTPIHQAVAVSLKPVFTWNDVERADMYEIHVAEDDKFEYINDDFISAYRSHTFTRTLKHNTTYYWRVRSKKFESYSTYSQRSFITLLASPTHVAPADSSKGVAKNTVLEWLPVDGATHYDVELSLTNDFTNVFKTVTNIEDTTVTLSGLDYLTKYYWRVKAKGLKNYGEFSQSWHFVTKLPPPILRFPANETKDMPTAITFLWTKSQAAETHFIQISKNSDLTEAAYDGQADTDSTHYFNFLEYQTTYYWRVYSSNSDGESEFSETWSFTTGIQGVTLISPENNLIKTDLAVQLVWNQFTDATKYQFQVATDPGFTTITHSDNDYLSLDFSLDNLEHFTTYYWRVRAILGTEVGNWSETWNFRTKMDKPSIIQPLNNATEVNSLARCEWDNLKGAETYLIHLSNDPNFDNLIVDKNTTLTLQDASLELNTKYYWRVRGLRSDEDGDWSDLYTFTTKVVGNVYYQFDNEAVQVYPNPTNNHFNIVVDEKELNLNALNIDEIVIMGMAGETIETIKDLEINNGSFKIDVKDFPSGTYFLMIKHDNKAIIKELKVVK